MLTEHSEYAKYFPLSFTGHLSLGKSTHYSCLTDAEMELRRGSPQSAEQGTVELVGKWVES